MKLLKLHINSEYGSIKEGFKLQFRTPYEDQIPEQIDWSDFHPFCFAGLNGSGKSNVLEALASIFYHIESCANVNQPENFQNNFKPERCKPNAFELEYYLCQDQEYKIENLIRVFISKKEKNKKEDGLPVMSYQPFPFDKEPILVSVVAEKFATDPAPAKRYLPDLVIGYSSGENEILSIPFLKTRLLHFDEYRVALEKKAEYKEPESSLLYVDYEMSQAVLLANLIFQKKEVLEPLHRELGIADIIRFRMNLNLHTHENKKILEQYKEVIDAFKRCATACYEEKNKLTLDFWINSASKEAFKANFSNNPFKLFQSFQILYTLNYRTVKPEIKSDVYQSKGFYTDGKVPIPEPQEKVFFFLDYYIKKKYPDSKEVVPLLMKNLSDGEQQFLHTMGICLMLKDKSALLLLDEPETHFNPDWRSKFIRTLKKSLDHSQSNNLMTDILITSHSPFIISDCYPDKVIAFEKGKQPINARDMNFRTYGTSVDIIMENIFKKRNTIGDLSRKEIEDIQKEIANRKKLSPKEVQEYKLRTNHLGDSMEKILLFARLNELEDIDA
ncbi:restriction system-associated AAA family ATPase [Algoriphagus sp. 4150]|uniref:restriction system-associated AAA family ATPase n=1 Tax=Algoriphagus sp. 4150 TaxID=2817756 RepID=UPI00285527D2|nr:restriction system-associated AAA family ATPase [Algoriphagus sp. 4150]MDR7131657.1 restriction system-associated AAA family ATPase [Algoriphagus sp. 4150]